MDEIEEQKEVFSNVEMSYEEFLGRLATTKGQWHITPLREIRHNTNQIKSCPGLLCGIFNNENRNFSWLVGEAADNRALHDPEIRRDLLEACGLSE